jgi:hypothetical protein
LKLGARKAVPALAVSRRVSLKLKPHSRLPVASLPN